VSLLVVFSHYYRTGCSITDPTPTTPTGATMLSAMPQGRYGQASTGLGLWLHHSVEGISNRTCKYMSPLETIKGEPGLTTKTRPSTQHTNTTLQASSLTE